MVGPKRYLLIYRMRALPHGNLVCIFFFQFCKTFPGVYFFFKSLLKQVEFIFVNKKNLDKYNRQNLENKIKKLCIFINWCWSKWSKWRSARALSSSVLWLFSVCACEFVVVFGLGSLLVTCSDRATAPCGCGWFGTCTTCRVCGCWVASLTHAQIQNSSHYKALMCQKCPRAVSHGF